MTAGLILGAAIWTFLIVHFGPTHALAIVLLLVGFYGVVELLCRVLLDDLAHGREARNPRPHIVRSNRP